MAAPRRSGATCRHARSLARRRPGEPAACSVEVRGTVSAPDAELSSEGVRGGHESHVTAVRLRSYAFAMAKQPSRVDLLELDIDLRLADLWREAGEIGEWNLEVLAAFMRAAYGKGYCDALTEDSPGSLCHDHGYRIPERRPMPAREPVEGS